MPKGVLDNPVALRDFFRGPFADLMVKLTGPHSLFYQTQLNMLLRMNPGEVLEDKLSKLIGLGRYDYVNPDVTSKYFPVMKIPQLKRTKLYHFNRSISSEDAIARMDADGYRPATIAELLIYGAKKPEMQRQFPIVALNSVAVIDGDRCVGTLYGDGSKRELSLNYFVNDWHSHYRFLAVRK